MSILPRVLGVIVLGATAVAVPFVAACGKAPAGPPAGASASAREDPKRAAKALTAEECMSLHDDEVRTLADTRTKNDAPCKTDAECIMVPAAVCGGSDCGGMPMAKVGEAAVRTRATELEQTTCAKWNDAGCPRIAPLPTPSCLAREPACIDGRCATRSPRGR